MKKSTCLAGALALGLIVPAAGLGASFVAVSGANAQQNASVAADPAGNFVVTWQSSGQDGDGWGVLRPAL